MEHKQPFAQWLKQRRKALDLTQHDLAKRVGCAVVTIQKIEEGHRRPSKQVAELLAKHLGLAVEEHAAFLQFARHGEIRQASAPASTSRLPTTPTNLPSPLTALIGRAREVAAITNYLGRPDIRLVTIVGPAGVGKTRLSIHTAERIAEQFRDGVWFVDLSPLTEATLVLPTIAYVLSIAETGVRPLVERLCAMLAERQLLLVLDNCEQVSEAASEIGVLLRGCKGLKILATSRTPLLLTGEQEYLAPPLSLPTANLVPAIALDQFMSYEAVQLFVARVRQHQPTFVITHANREQIVTICLRLDGLPLALELAAAALRRMTLPQLADLLGTKTNWLHELHSPARDLPPRQRTLYQAIAWSYSLLDANSQLIFRQLGIFVGGFNIKAAQAICAADQSVLAGLTDHNLLVRAAERWQMLVMIHEFALTQMSVAERTATQQRHIAYFVAQPTSNPDSVAVDHANFRAALLAAIATYDTHAALTLSIKLDDFWQTYGNWREGIDLARRALALPDKVPDKGEARLRVDALESVATLAWQHHQFEAALEFAEQALTLARSRAHPEELAMVLNLLGRIFIEQGDYAGAETVLKESAAFAGQVPHLFNPGCPFAQLGEVALARTDWVAAQSHLAQAVSYFASNQGTLWGAFVAIAHTILAEVALAFNNPNKARHELRQALSVARLSFRRVRCLLVTLAGLLLTTVHTTPAEDAQAAAAFLGAEAGLGEQTDAPSLLLYQTLIAQRTASIQSLLPQPTWQAAWQQGHTWTLEEAVAAAERWLSADHKTQF